MATHEAPKDPRLDTNHLELPGVPDIIPDIEIWESQSKEYEKEKFRKVCGRLFELGVGFDRDHLFGLPTEDGFYRVFFTKWPIKLIDKNGEEVDEVNGQRIIVNRSSEEFDGRRVTNTYDYLIKFDAESLIYLRSRVEHINGRVQPKDADGPLIVYLGGQVDVPYGKEYANDFTKAKFRQSHTLAMDQLLEQLKPLNEALRDDIY